MSKSTTQFGSRLRHFRQAMVSLHPLMTDGTGKWMNVCLAAIIKENAP